MSTNVDRTRTFFNRWRDYSALATALEGQKNREHSLQGELSGRLIDVGNGGVFGYDLTAVHEVIAVDIAEEVFERIPLPPKVSFRRGDAADLPLNDSYADTVLSQLVLHHLAEATVAASRARVQKALSEAFRVLKPGGRFVLLESCLPPPWETVEKAVYRAAAALLKLFGHPLVLQWSAASLRLFMEEAGFHDIRVKEIPLGKMVIQLGMLWPSRLTPVKTYKFTGTKP